MPTMTPHRIRIILATLAILFAIGPGRLWADHPTLHGPPQVIEVPEEELPRAELLGTPEVRTLLGYTRRVLHLHDGHTLAIFSFSNAAKANWLFLIDGRDLSFERYDIPNNDIGAHGAALGSDGNIYIMPYGNGRAYRFDVRTRQFQPIEVDLPQTDYTWDALGTSDGQIYFGTYPNAYFGRYDIATGRCDLRRQVVPNSKYTRSFTTGAEGRIWFQATGPGKTWMVYDAQTDALNRGEGPPGADPPAPAGMEPELPPGAQRFGRQITAGERRFVISFPNSRFWEVGTDGSLALRGDPQAPAEVWFLEQTADAVLGISHFGAAFRYDLNSGKFQHSRLSNRAAAGNGIMFIEAVTPRCVLGANYSQQNLFRIDPQTGQIDTAEQMIARVTGEPMCAVGFAGKAYLGIYVNSLISVYDPEHGFAFGQNPRELIELGSQYQQTRPRSAITDGQHVYISSDSAYNCLGGALAVVEPASERIDVYHHLVRDQNLPTLAYDAKTRLVWGGTDRWGQMRSHPPTQASSQIYAFDPQTRRVVDVLTPWPESDITDVLGVCRGVLLASCDSQIALVDTSTRQVLYRGASTVAIPRRIVVGSDGHGYWLAGGTLYRWELPANRLTPVARCPGCYFLTESSPGTWCVANGASVYRVRL
jgi:streptogramin lyase